MTAELKVAARRPVSFFHTMRAVAWSFIGIRRSSGQAEDMQKLNPVHVVMGGILGAALFVGAIVLLVRWVVDSGVAR
jgi:nitrate reductase gamma subunit